jgi:hypothetical protein
MTRVSRSDSLLTELRDIKRRLRLLEAIRMRQTTPAASGLLAAIEGSVLTPVLLPAARPVDWPATTSVEWERLAAVRLSRAYVGDVAIHVTVAAEEGTSGEVRVLADDVRVGESLPVQEDIVTHTMTVSVSTTDVEIVVEARRASGGGSVRVSALLVPLR